MRILADYSTILSMPHAELVKPRPSILDGLWLFGIRLEAPRKPVHGLWGFRVSRHQKKICAVCSLPVHVGANCRLTTAETFVRPLTRPLTAASFRRPHFDPRRKVGHA